MTEQLELQIFIEQVCEEYELQAKSSSHFIPLGEFLENQIVGSPPTVIDISWKRAAAAELISLREQLAIAAGLPWQRQQILAELPAELHPEAMTTVRETGVASGVSFISEHDSRRHVIQAGMTLGPYTLLKH